MALPVFQSQSQITPSADHYPTDYQGSYDEWVLRVAKNMAARYGAGDESVYLSLSGNTGAIGQPDRRDFGSGKMSESTYDFFVRYISTYAESDKYLTETYGAPPQRVATYGQDPNSIAAQDARAAAEAERSRAFDADQAERDRVFQGGQREADRAVTREGFANDWKIAIMDDLTRRYVAEGDWGVQKYVADLQDKGALERLKLELGFRDKELTQRALEAKQQHHQAMIGLALEVAKYDAELGQEPRNWLAYASWLQNRDMVVDGLNLAMAADMVPEAEAAAEATGTGSPTGQISAQMTLKQQKQPAQAGGGTTLDTQGASGASAQTASPGGPQVGQYNLASTDYAGLARQLMGSAAGAQTAPPSTQQLQAAYDSTETNFDRAPGPGGFGAWGGPTTTSQGVRVNASGHQENYTNFRNLLPAQQEMRLGAVQGVRGKFGVNDFLQEMERARPKGSTVGAAALG